MKKFLIGIAVGGMMLTSASAAEARNQRNDWVGPLVIGTVIGTILGTTQDYSPPQYRDQRRWSDRPRRLPRRYLPIDRPRIEGPRRPYRPRYVKKCMTYGADWTPNGYRPRIACHYVPIDSWPGRGYYEARPYRRN